MIIVVNSREIDTQDITGTQMQESSDAPARLTLGLRGYSADDPEGMLVVEGDGAVSLLRRTRDAEDTDSNR